MGWLVYSLFIILPVVLQQKKVAFQLTSYCLTLPLLWASFISRFLYRQAQNGEECVGACDKRTHAVLLDKYISNLCAFQRHYHIISIGMEKKRSIVSRFALFLQILKLRKTKKNWQQKVYSRRWLDATAHLLKTNIFSDGLYLLLTLEDENLWIDDNCAACIFRFSIFLEIDTLELKRS